MGKTLKNQRMSQIKNRGDPFAVPHVTKTLSVQHFYACMYERVMIIWKYMVNASVKTSRTANGPIRRERNERYSIKIPSEIT